MSVLLFLAILAISFAIYSIIKSVKRPKNYPPGPNFVPFMGNSIQLHKEAKDFGGQHKVFEKWSKKYNSNVLGLKLGNDLVVVALKYPLVREIHLQEVFEGRPDTFFIRMRTMGKRSGITFTDGKLWYEHRNFAMKQMRNVGYGKTQMEKHIEKEASSIIELLEGTNESPVWPGSFLPPSVINVLWSLVAGQRIDRGDKKLINLLDLLHKRSKVFDMSGGFLSQFPWLRFIAPNKTGYNLVQKINQEMLSFFSETINEHKRNMTSENSESDVIYSYIKEMQEHSGKDNNSFNDTQLTMIILDFFIAGSQTTSNTLNLAIMMLALNSDMQNIFYKEIIDKIKENSNEIPHLSSRVNFPFVDAFIMEVQRFFHIIPISGPRRTLWDTTLDGYDIPKNTTILIGLRSVLMDKEHWCDPENFRPDRFIDAEGKTVRDEYFMPFGQGRRRCFADSLARACIFSFLTTMVQRFKIEFDSGEPNLLELQPGMILSPKTYKVKFIKRMLLQ